MKKIKLLKICGFLVFSFCMLISKAQKLNIDKIDTSNYYDYNVLQNTNQQKYLKGKDLVGFFLRKHEAIYIITDELSKKRDHILPNVLYQLEDKRYITLDVYDADKDIGYLYIDIIWGGGKKMRAIRSPYLESHKADYVQCVWAKGGDMAECYNIVKLPDNIKIIWAEWYWFQYTENKEDDKYLITKKIAEKILRQDIDKSSQ